MNFEFHSYLKFPEKDQLACMPCTCMDHHYITNLTARWVIFNNILNEMKSREWQMLNLNLYGIEGEFKLEIHTKS